MAEEFVVEQRPNRCPTHPGQLLEEALTALRLPVREAAKQLGVSRQTLHRLISGRHAVTPEMAVRLGKFCGNGPRLWLRMQQSYDLWRVERDLAAEIEKIPTHSLEHHLAV